MRIYYSHKHTFSYDYVMYDNFALFLIGNGSRYLFRFAIDFLGIRSSYSLLTNVNATM